MASDPAGHCWGWSIPAHWLPWWRPRICCHENTGKSMLEIMVMMLMVMTLCGVTVDMAKLHLDFLLCLDSCTVVCLNWEDSSSWLSTQLAAADSSTSWSYTNDWPTVPAEGATDIVFCSKVTGFSAFTSWSHGFWGCKNAFILLQHVYFIYLFILFYLSNNEANNTDTVLTSHQGRKAATNRCPIKFKIKACTVAYGS